MLSLEDADSAQANLPFSGGKIGASLARGSSIDIALLMIGKKTSTTTTLDRAGLTGSCAEATHYVKGAWIGAFAMKSGTVGAVAASGQLFGVGASGESSSKKGIDSKSGNVDACKAPRSAPDPDQPDQPKGCGAPLRVDLAAITAQPVKEKQEEKKPGLECPTGLVAIDDRCAPPKATARTPASRSTARTA